MKGIILAGGYGTRLYPLTLGVSKQLLPVYDKPMIYYPLSVLIHSGIKEILIITTLVDLGSYKKLIGDGSQIGLNIKYKTQEKPLGIAQSFLIGSDFIGNDNVCLILGDNIFHSKEMTKYTERAIKNLEKNYSTIFGVQVDNPNDFGVIEQGPNGKILKILEKPNQTKSKLIVSGLYFYTNDVLKVASSLKPSDRGELEITDVNNYYLTNNKLRLVKLSTDDYWTDAGTYNSLIKASKYFRDYELLHNKKIACIEQLVFELGYINKSQIQKIANIMKNSDYGKYLQENILKV